MSMAVWLLAMRLFPPPERPKEEQVAAPADGKVDEKGAAAAGDLGDVTMARVVPRLSATPGTVRHAGHRVGHDTRRVLHEVLEMSAAQIEALAAAKVILCSDRQDDEPSR